MKSFTTAAKNAIGAGSSLVGGAVKIGCVPPVRVWSGEGTIQISGEDFIGVGDRGIAENTGATIGSSASGLTLTLSGVDPDALALINATGLKGSPCQIWRLIFDGTGTSLLDAQTFSRGRVDDVSTNETVGGEAKISVAIEGAARGLGRRSGRLRTDADQRLIDSTDGGYRQISYAGQKTLYWGGKKPTNAGTALGSSNGSATPQFSGGGISSLSVRPNLF